jgi:NAD(P)-dependent dehydrogenase (short-subunit alcohol dehydrogenase family)
MNLQDRVAWITGGARMGLEVARVLSQTGCRIVLSYRSSKEEAHETAETIREWGGEVFVTRCDLTKKAHIVRAVNEIQKQFGRFDVLVNLASMYEKEKWALHWKTNADSAYELTKSVTPLMQRSGGGRIIHIGDWTSASGRPRYAGYGGYYASKAAIQALVEISALELAPKILVNAIAPGPMLPPKGMSAKEYRAVEQATPLKRWGGAEEIAKAVRYLCESDFVTGETIRVDGGRHLY